jgi:hypothetical protein
MIQISLDGVIREVIMSRSKLTWQMYHRSNHSAWIGCDIGRIEQFNVAVTVPLSQRGTYRGIEETSWNISTTPLFK